MTRIAMFGLVVASFAFGCVAEDVGDGSYEDGVEGKSDAFGGKNFRAKPNGSFLADGETGQVEVVYNSGDKMVLSGPTIPIVVGPFGPIEPYDDTEIADLHIGSDSGMAFMVLRKNEAGEYVALSCEEFGSTDVPYGKETTVFKRLRFDSANSTWVSSRAELTDCDVDSRAGHDLSLELFPVPLALNAPKGSVFSFVNRSTVTAGGKNEYSGTLVLTTNDGFSQGARPLATIVGDAAESGSGSLQVERWGPKDALVEGPVHEVYTRELDSILAIEVEQAGLGVVVSWREYDHNAHHKSLKCEREGLGVDLRFKEIAIDFGAQEITGDGTTFSFAECGVGEAKHLQSLRFMIVPRNFDDASFDYNYTLSRF